MRIALVGLCTVNGGLNPIGILSLASWLKAHRPQHEVTLIEAANSDPLRQILSGEFDAVGISAMTLEYERATKLASEIRAATSPTIILGGAHITNMPESFRRAFDIGVIGEGEDALCELLDVLPDWERLAEVPGLVYWGENGTLQRTAPRTRLIDLERYPALRWQLLPRSYWTRRPLGLFGAFGIEAEIITTRGCPFRCSFCASTRLWSRVRSFSTAWIVNELRTLTGYGVTHVQIVDDLFTINKRRLREISQEVQRAGLDLSFAANSKANVIDDEIAGYLKAMNCTIIGFGFESGNDRVLRMLKGETATVRENKEAISLCVRHGLRPLGGVIFGSPTETLQEMRESLEFIRWAWAAGANRIFAFVLIPYPDTAMWEIAKARGTVSDDVDFDELDLNPEHGAAMNPKLLDDSISLDQFREVMEQAARAVHPFKWRKIWLFIRNNPLETLLYALRCPFALIKRTLNPKAF